MKKSKQLLFAVLILVLGGLISYFLIITKDNTLKSNHKMLMPTAKIIKAKATNYQVNLFSDATVIPAKKVMLTSQVSGVIKKLATNLAPGAMFNKNEMLILLNPQDYILKKSQYFAKLQQAQLKLQQEQAMQIVAQNDYDRIKNKNSMSAAGRDLAIRKPHLQVAQSSVLAAKSNFQLSELALKRTNIKAPFNCVITKKLVEIGQLVSPQTPLLQLVGVDEFWVKAFIPLKKLSFINLPNNLAEFGSNVVITQKINNNENIIKQGKIIRLLSEADSVGYMAQLLIGVKEPMENNNGIPLLLNSHVQVKIEGKTIKNVIALPHVAIDSGKYVWIADHDDRIHRHKVDIVYANSSTTFVKNNFHKNNRIIINKLLSPIANMKIKPIYVTKEEANAR